jgi:hypothetical protein
MVDNCVQQEISTRKCQAITLQGNQCACKVRLITEEGIEVCGNHKSFKKSDHQYIKHYVAEREFSQMQKEFIAQLNRDIQEGHEQDIPLRNEHGLIACFTFVDPEDFDRYRDQRWHLSQDGYAKSGNIMLHQCIMGKTAQGYVIDHIDGNRLNNHKTNLRIVTISINNQNRPKKQCTSSTYIGVSCVNGKWQVAQGGKRLGTYDSELEAAKRYDTYVLLKYGVHARTNGLVQLCSITTTLSDFNSIITRDLPTYVTTSVYKGKTTLYYVACRTYDKVRFQKKCLSLQDAVNYLHNIDDEIAKMKAKKEIQHNTIVIARDNDGNAVICIYDKAQNVVDRCIVDDHYYHELLGYRWSHNKEYAQVKISKKNVLMHRYIIKAKPGDIVDHINGRKNDNRLSNLRIVSASVNSRNKIGKGASQYLGVKMDKKTQRWTCSVTMNGTRYHCGSYTTDVEAAIAVNLMSIKLYGNHAKLNMIPDKIYKQYIDSINEKMTTRLAKVIGSKL